MSEKKGGNTQAAEIIMDKTKSKTVLPQLAYGEGTMKVNDRGIIVYKKYIHLRDGKSLRKTIHGKTVTECFKRMDKIEKKLQKGKTVKRKNNTFNDEMAYWLNEVKKNTLKKQSFQRLESLIRIHIYPSDMGHMRVSLISSNDLQSFINSYNNGSYSYSSIKKIYDCLNDFFRYISLRDGIDNPMLPVTNIKKQNVIKKTKKVEFLNEEDIKKFREEAVKTWKSSGNLRYRYGYVLIANLYLGLRIGELLALKWKDVHFEKDYIQVDKTLVQERIIGKKGEATKASEKSNIYLVQDSTKTNKNRKVPMNSTAKKYLLMHFNSTEYNEVNDFVISTKNGKNSTTKNIQSTMSLIFKNAHIQIEASNTHIMRHTCATLLYNKGVDLHTIAKILGNSEEVLKKTYVHFEEDTLSSVMELIADIN